MIKDKEKLKKKIAYDIAWKQAHIRNLCLQINITETEVWNKLDNVPNKRKYVVDLIKEDIKKNGI